MGAGFQFQRTGTISGIGLYIIEYLGNPDYAMGFVTISGTPSTTNDAYPYFFPDTDVGTMYSNSEWQSFEPDVMYSIA